MLPATAVKKSGEHSDLIKISADSVKVMLVKISEDRWTLRALIPIENTYPRESVTVMYTPSDPDYPFLHTVS